MSSFDGGIYNIHSILVQNMRFLLCLACFTACPSLLPVESFVFFSKKRVSSPPLLLLEMNKDASRTSAEATTHTSVTDSSTERSSNSGSTATTLLPTTIVGIRHASSQSNEWMSQPGNQWGDPTFRDDPAFRDARLSASGEQQAREELTKRLQELVDSQQDPFDLILVSPLTRCLQTWLYGVRPVIEKEFCEKEQPPTIVLPLLRERVYTSGEIGRVRSELQQDFGCPELDWSHVPDEPWWYNSNESTQEWRPHGNGQYYAVPGEPKPVFQERLNTLDEWLQEHCAGKKDVLIVAHWGVLRHFTQQEVENCGLCTFELKVKDYSKLSNK